VDSSVAVFDIRSMDSHVESALLAPRLAWALSSASGLVGLVLALIGIYGVVNFAVARRRRELGIRLAVGASPGQILLMILRQGLSVAGIGVAIGCLTTFGLSRFAASLLYGVSPTDTLTFIAIPSLLVAVAALACLVPARRAAGLDPAEVLRTE
jgi:ABC-type antimicrobial peptide transport system permease subunit